MEMNNKNVKDLRQIAKERGIKYYYTKPKRELINELSQLTNSQEPTRTNPAPRQDVYRPDRFVPMSIKMEMSSKKVEDLRQIAKNQGIKYYYSKRKSDLINELSQSTISQEPIRPIPAPHPNVMHPDRYVPDRYNSVIQRSIPAPRPNVMHPDRYVPDRYDSVIQRPISQEPIRSIPASSTFNQRQFNNQRHFNQRPIYIQRPFIQRQFNTTRNVNQRHVPVRPIPAPRPNVMRPSRQVPVIQRPIPAPRPSVMRPSRQVPVIQRPIPAPRHKNRIDEQILYLINSYNDLVEMVKPYIPDQIRKKLEETKSEIKKKTEPIKPPIDTKKQVEFKLTQTAIKNNKTIFS
ncbi:serum response factor-binding protein 1-like [Hydra vulgaris]|uniref:Serum response factor-binding protein 1-like n=1 Tax=Hydra vulgaris TaxID=6087 RepID=A0ABM4BPT0_HYDVU